MIEHQPPWDETPVFHPDSHLGVVAGVIDVLTYDHRPKLADADAKYQDDVAPPGSPFIAAKPLISAEGAWRSERTTLPIAWISDGRAECSGLGKKTFISTDTPRGGTNSAWT